MSLFPRCHLAKFSAGLSVSALLAVAVACARDGSAPDERNSSIQSVNEDSLPLDVEKISFSQWCERWGLSCPKQTSDVDGLGESQESLRWQAIAQLFERFMTSGSNFSLEESELSSGKTRILLTQMGLQDVYGDVLNVLRQSGLKKVVIEPDGKIRFEARVGVNGQAGTVRGNSGMKWTFKNQGQVSVGTGGQYLFNGLLFAAANSFESDVFGRLGFNDQDKTIWSGSNLAVTHVPDGFFIRDVPVRWEKFSELKRAPVLRALTELRDLVFIQGRNIKVNKSFFDNAAQHIPLFVEDDKLVTPITRLTDALGGLEMKAPTTGSALAQVTLERASSIVCRIEMTGTPAIELTLDRRFGVQNAYTNEKSNAQVDLFGINIKARVGLPIAFNLKRVDIEPTRIVVKGVPVIGEIAIPLPEEGQKFGKELKKLECNERI